MHNAMLEVMTQVVNGIIYLLIGEGRRLTRQISTRMTYGARLEDIQNSLPKNL